MSYSLTGGTNLFFNNYNSFGEQNLIESLITEAIAIYGQSMYYIPRNIVNEDNVYGEDALSSYTNPYLVCIYIKSVDGFTGDQEFMSKFGVEIRDQVVFSISQRIFSQCVGSYTNQPRPNEGDLIYFPLNQKCFQIKYTNKFEMFYQMGSLQTWEMTCELFEYSDEIINTGIPEVDILQKQFSTNILDFSYLDEFGHELQDENEDYLVVEPFIMGNVVKGSENDVLPDGTTNFETGSNGFIDFSDSNPFGE